jgi:Transglycosylase SLT domain
VATATANPNVTRWTPLVEKSAAKWHVPTALLLAQIDQESGGKLGEVSSAGAGGLTQFTPSTAAQYGVKYGNGKAEVESQLEGQARLMSNLLRSYDGNASKALEAYNAGKAGTGLAEPENYAKIILAKVSEYGGSGGTENVSFIPEAFQNAVPGGKAGAELSEKIVKAGAELSEKAVPGVKEAKEGLSGLKAVDEAFGDLLEPKNWVRIAEGLIGAILILSALKTLSSKYGVSRTVVAQGSEGAVFARVPQRQIKKRKVKSEKAVATRVAKKAAEAAAE